MNVPGCRSESPMPQREYEVPAAAATEAAASCDRHTYTFLEPGKHFATYVNLMLNTTSHHWGLSFPTGFWRQLYMFRDVF